MLGRATFGPHSADPEGYYQLSGRAELAMLVHEKVLPSYSFEGTPEGVQETHSRLRECEPTNCDTSWFLVLGHSQGCR